MTTSETKTARRNELLRAFDPSATNIETLCGLGLNFDFRKKRVQILENGQILDRKMITTEIENQPITYIIK